MNLDSLDEKSFQQSGILALRKMLPAREIAYVRKAIFIELERIKIKVGSKFVAPKIQALPVFQQTNQLSTLIKPVPELDALFQARLSDVLDNLAGARLKAAHPQLLLSLPHKQAWSIAKLNWHLDLAIPDTDVIPGIQAFILLDDLAPQGGATIAIAGSHKLPYLKKPATSAHTVLRQHPHFSNLFNSATLESDSYFTPTCIGNHEVYLVEMAGRAGDVFLMDLEFFIHLQ